MSWISYLDSNSFPVENLPFGIFSSKSIDHLNLNVDRRIGVAIGDYVLDMGVLRWVIKRTCTHTYKYTYTHNTHTYT